MFSVDNMLDDPQYIPVTVMSECLLSGHSTSTTRFRGVHMAVRVSHRAVLNLSHDLLFRHPQVHTGWLLYSLVGKVPRGG
jgi:hypothetical protein